MSRKKNSLFTESVRHIENRITQNLLIVFKRAVRFDLVKFNKCISINDFQKKDFQLIVFMLTVYGYFNVISMVKWKE